MNLYNRQFLVVRKKFFDIWKNIRKYNRVIIQSPILNDANDEIEFIEWLENTMKEEYVRFIKIDESYISSTEINVIYFSYYISSYDFRDFELKVMGKNFDEKYHIDEETRDKLGRSMEMFANDIVKNSNIKIVDII